MGPVTHPVIDASDDEGRRLLAGLNRDRSGYPRLCWIAGRQVDDERCSGVRVTPHSGRGRSRFGDDAAVEAERETGALIIENLQRRGRRATGQNDAGIGVDGLGRDRHGLGAIHQGIVHREDVHRSGGLVGKDGERDRDHGLGAVAATQQHQQWGRGDTVAGHRERGLATFLQDSRWSDRHIKGHQIAGGYGQGARTTAVALGRGDQGIARGGFDQAVVDDAHLEGQARFAGGDRHGARSRDLAWVPIDQGDGKGGREAAGAAHRGQESLAFHCGSSREAQGEGGKGIIIENVENGRGAGANRCSAAGIAEAEGNRFGWLLVVVVNNGNRNRSGSFPIGEVHRDRGIAVVIAGRRCAIAEVEPHTDGSILAATAQQLHSTGGCSIFIHFKAAGREGNAAG